MRVLLELRPRSGELVVPLHYNSLLQGLVYRLMAGTAIAGFLHDRGFLRGRRSYKMFTFSRVEGRYDLVEFGERPAGPGASRGDMAGGQAPPARKRFLRFSGPVRLTVSSPYEPVCHVIANNALKGGEVWLGTQALEVEGVRFQTVSLPRPPLRLRARTPITVYSTVTRQDGSRFTYYFEPRSGEFERLVAENLVRKFEAFWGRPYDGQGVTILWRGRARPHIVRFRRGVIKGFTGVFDVEGDPELIRLGIEAGFGSKNAQGFGLCDLCHPRAAGPEWVEGVGGVDGAH